MIQAGGLVLVLLIGYRFVASSALVGLRALLDRGRLRVWEAEWRRFGTDSVR